jgi:signal transduction histidine kinase
MKRHRPWRNHRDWPRSPARFRRHVPFYVGPSVRSRLGAHLAREMWVHEHPWPHAWMRKRRFLFFRLAGVFGFMAVLVLGGVAVLAFLLARAWRGGGHTAGYVWIGGIVLVLTLPLVAVAFAFESFRKIAVPLADLVAAADAVAKGDLSVRIPASDSEEFGQLVESFNRMVEELERADQQRKNLTADVAHELRTPLHIIQGNLEGVLDGVYEATAEHINATLDETRQLSRLVEDLRTLSLAEAGQLALTLEEVNVGELLADVWTSFSGQAEAAGIAFEINVDGEVEDRPIVGDVGRLEQVLANLVSNAIRYTPRGGTITLGATTVEDGIRVAVHDSGEGILAEDLPYVFDRFWRGDRSRAHGNGAGSGLGLAIAQQLVRAHGGQIYVESEVGQGTTFTVGLPRSGPPNR